MRILYHSSRALSRWVYHSSNSTTRRFTTSSRFQVVKPFLLADIGEGIRECEMIQWFVEPEARVEQFDKLCEVQSDKASVEITSRFDGVIKKLHYEAGQMAIVGKPLVDIDIQGEVKQEDLDAIAMTDNIKAEMTPGTNNAPLEASSDGQSPAVKPMQDPIPKEAEARSKHSSLATPAVRHLIKEFDVNIEHVSGTGKDGRVLKEDVYKFAKIRDTQPLPKQPAATEASFPGLQQENVIQLTGIRLQMFKAMTRSTNIPHFLYADEIDFSALSKLRQRLNSNMAISPAEGISKISYMPFLIKAMSLSLHQYPILNARLDSSDPTKPSLVMRSQHNIGIAIDTPQGLIVPVIKNVSSRSLLSIASELQRLQRLAKSNALSSEDLKGGTITLSNIGNIGGTYLSPVIVDKEVAILGVGKIKRIPAFDEHGHVVGKDVAIFSWSADHRVVDGATMARAGEVVKGFVEAPDSMMIHLR